jgi:hypothetical protein
MGFDPEAWDAQHVTDYGDGSRSHERIKDKVLPSDPPVSQDLFHPVRRKAGGIAKPPVNG